MTLAVGIERRPIVTARLVLEPFDAHHADGCWAAVEVSLPELRPWLIWTKDASPQMQREFAESRAETWRSGHAFTFAILHDGLFAGACGTQIYNPGLPDGEIGYWLRSDCAGKGYATEATRAVRDFSFDIAGRHRLSLRAGVDNIASQRVAEKSGFQREGIMRDGGHGAGAAYDCYLYGMLATDARP